jgi:alpha-L-fucosidase
MNRRDFLALSAAASLSRIAHAKPSASPRFSPNLDSLAGYKAPEWFRDAKFGIWNCWGPESVPEMGDWYARKLYVEGDPTYKSHLEIYGHPSKFGYKDMVPLWQAENWNPDRLMGLYKKAGAKYFFAIAQHHDNIDCWNSKYHPWNSVKMGPKKDVLSIWGKTARAHGLKYGVSEHLGASWNWFGVAHTADKTGPMAGVPYDGADPAFASLYHSGDQDSDWHAWYHNAPQSFQIEWSKRVTDLIDQMQPDLVYSDGSLPFGQYGMDWLAHYYNSNIARHNGKLEAVYFCKNNPDGGQFRNGFCVQDIERGVEDGINPLPWQTDTCIGDWYYKKGIAYKTPTTVIQMLIDIVSKNGNLLLSVPPRGDGTLDSQEEQILADIGTWMAANGAAIYSSRPWRVFGEGHNGPKPGNFNEDQLTYTAEDIRYTNRNGELFAFALAWPASGKLLLKSLAGTTPSAVHMLDGNDTLKFTTTADGLSIQLPPQPRGAHAYGVRILGVTA